MKKCWKKIAAFVIALAVAVSYMPVDEIFAASAPGSTESIDGPDEETVNGEVYFVSAANGKLISLNGTSGDGISCETSYGGSSSSVPSNAKFTIYYGTQTSGICQFQGETVVNFTCEGTNTSWGGNSGGAYQIGSRTNPDGWECVKMVPQGDGTVAFRECDSGKYFTVDGNYLSVIEIGDGEQVSNNEKFVMYTETVPKTAKKVTLTEVAGDSVTVSWQGVDECMYSGYEVLYSTSEDGPFNHTETTADTTYQVTGLALNTKYYFKVRTLVNNDSNVYADSQLAYTTTLSAYKPSNPTGVEATWDDGAIDITWDATSNTTEYHVYRAMSRFGDYEEIAVTTDTRYKDTQCNEPKYDNYYKIQAVNDVDGSKMSDPASLEITMFGSDMYIFSENDDPAQVDEVTEQIFNNQHYNQFGDERYVLAYKSGDYTDTDLVNVGYYTQVLGLGKTPYDVRLNNVHAPAALSGNNATCNFWVGIENLTIADTDQNGDYWYDFQWSVSQAAPARRLNVERHAQFDYYWGWASGGFIADSVFQQQAGSYSQQQYYYRNCEMQQGIYGVNWNQVVQGCEGITNDNSADNSGQPFVDMISLMNNNGLTNWDQRGCTTIIDTTDEIREKPFLFYDDDSDAYKVFVPAMREDSKGVSWSEDDMGEGAVIDVEKCFYIARPDKDTAATINQQLAWGENIIFAPGVYYLDEPIQVNEPETILLGLGMATLVPENDQAAIKTADVAGLSICGLILDAGDYSDTLIEVGPEGCNRDHEHNPTLLADIFYRVGGATHLGRCESCQVINCDDVIIDHTWIWRADHGSNTGWDVNTAANGLVVNGDRVTAYGLFCEHFQEYDILWRGDYGKTYFVQNEKCYDPQNQADWMSHDGTKNGYAAYKVANNVENHYAVGIGIYDVFINTNGASIFLDNAMEVPDTPNVLIENACTVEIASTDGPMVGINHIINGDVAGIHNGGGSTDHNGYAIQRLLSYVNGVSVSLADYYDGEENHDTVTEEGDTPTDDSHAEKDLHKDDSSEDPDYSYPTPPAWSETDEGYLEKQEALHKQDSESQGDDESGNTESGNSGNDTNTDANKGDTEASGASNTSNENGDSASTSSSTTVKVGDTIEDDMYIYKVTQVNGNTGKAKLIGVVAKYRKTLKKSVVKAKITKDGCKLKVTAIGKKAFKKCTKLKTVKVGKNVKTIQKKAFFKCKKLKRVVLKKNVKTIKAKAFAQSKKLKKVTVKGKKLKKVAKNAFNKKVRKKLKVKGKKKSKKVLLKSLGRL